MFTGIIEEIGSLAKITRRGQTLQLEINAAVVLNDIHLGDSVAVNGVCLTVTKFTRRTFSVDVMPVTYQDTSLAMLTMNARLNLERAMAANGRFGGHIVSGHVDGVGCIVNKTLVENAWLYRLEIPTELAKYCIPKGSIAVDGTSLTIVATGSNWLSVSLIPHTQEKTVLGTQGVGARVNLECDILAKFATNVENFKPTLNHGFLQEHGFI